MAPVNLGINIPNSPAQEQTIGWKTYLNGKYGFEIKIPPNWIAGEYADGTLGFDTQDLKNASEKNISDCKQGKGCTPELSSDVVEFVYINKDGDRYSSDDLVNGSSTVVLNGISWTRYQPTGLYENIRFRTAKNGAGYDFVTDDKKYEDTLKQVLSTFKFINK